MVIKKVGVYTIKKDGTSYYRVYKKRTRIGSFLTLQDAVEYMELKISKEEK